MFGLMRKSTFEKAEAYNKTQYEYMRDKYYTCLNRREEELGRNKVTEAALVKAYTFKHCLISGTYFAYDSEIYKVKEIYKQDYDCCLLCRINTGYYSIHVTKEIDEAIWEEVSVESVDKEVLDHFDLVLVDAEV